MSINIDNYPLLLWACFAIVIIRICVEPYLLWKEKNDRCKELESILDERKIGENSYAQQIGSIFDDLIINWNKQGVSSWKDKLFRYCHPRSYHAWHKLERLSTNLSLEDELRSDVKKFLDLFEIRGKDDSPFPGYLYTIKTKIKTREGIETEKDNIKELAISISKRLRACTFIG